MYLFLEKILNIQLFLDRFFFGDKQEFIGINAMSISDISGIPRATVIRKLNKLVKGNFLIIDSKKHYSTNRGVHKKKLLVVQNNTFINLSKFAARIYNLSLIKNNWILSIFSKNKYKN